MTLTTSNQFKFLPCLDSKEIANSRKQTLMISHQIAASLGQSAVQAISQGYYHNAVGIKVDWSDAVNAARQNKLCISPTDALPDFADYKIQPETHIQVSNETTILAAKRLTESGLRPLALNFANGIQPGGGFLHGALAQEETLCRSSALYATLVNDPMYETHQQRPLPDSTDWAIYSPDVPFFRNDEGITLPQPWLLSILTCAAPYAPSVGRQKSSELLRQRIKRVLYIARAYGYTSMVLGAWGCGAFENDAHQTAVDFRHALETDFRGAFSNIVFAITDWSPKRKFLGPFREVFSDAYNGFLNSDRPPAYI
jgi:uncharacterized protein (TIGR02452 family)